MIEEKLQSILKDHEIKSYIGDLPSTSMNAVGIILYPGTYNTEYFGKGTLCTPVVKIVVRNKSYAEGSDIIDTVKDILHRYCDEELLSVLMSGTPSYLGRDPQKLHTFQIVFNIKIKE